MENIHEASACELYVVRLDGDREYFSFHRVNCVKELLAKAEEFKFVILRIIIFPVEFLLRIGGEMF